jgi:hypothetical protein
MNMYSVNLCFSFSLLPLSKKNIFYFPISQATLNLIEFIQKITNFYDTG